MTEQQIDQDIREACVKANPALEYTDRGGSQMRLIKYPSLEKYSLQLADILLAINKDNHSSKLISHNNYIYYKGTVLWNLTLPYSGQSIETKRFVYELIK